ncbi:hypothetical protein ABGB12_22070 [Actinocorallia sp. B10E7]|uniref:hypothetical protein n=1 Tax=Actinocorallia sp. B10E7 TaxID=3153558 RepID=UPI00325EDFEB
MDEGRREESGHVERGASEEASDAPMTPTEKRTSRRSASSTPGTAENEKEQQRGRHDPSDFSPDDFE